METIKDLIKQMEEWPVSVLLVVVLNFVGTSMRRTGAIPNKTIPSALMALGAITYIFVGDTGAIHFTSRYPTAILAMYGCLLGVLAWLANALIWKAIEKRFPQIKNGNGDTETIIKPKPTEPIIPPKE